MTPLAASKSHVLICEAGAAPASCQLPVAKAYDHYDKELPVQKVFTRVLTETNGVPVPQLKQFSGLEYNKPAEWIIEHNTCDSSNNCAEPVKFTVIFRDTQAPVIDTAPLSTIPSTMAAGGKSSVFEAPKTTAVDNMDGVVSVSVVPSTISTYAAGSRKIVYSAHDYAGVFGENGNNVATIVKEFNVIDTTPPTITDSRGMGHLKESRFKLHLFK